MIAKAYTWPTFQQQFFLCNTEQFIPYSRKNNIMKNSQYGKIVYYRLVYNTKYVNEAF